MSIERRLFRLVLLTGVLCFVLFEAVSFFGLYDVERRVTENSREMGESAAEFAQELADSQAKQRFALLAREKAHRIGNEMERLQEDTELLAKDMTQILTHRERYRPRRLPIGGETPIASGEPYLFFLPILRESGRIPDILPDADIAANGADNLSLWAGSYENGHQMTCFFASELGYIISADNMPEGTEFVDFFEEWDSPSFDTRERPWYREAKSTGKTVFTDVYVGIEGYPAISCVAPYYDEQGFAGVAGMSNNIHSLYRQIAKSDLEGTEVNFVLNKKGEVLLSSEKNGILAVSEPPVDLRDEAEQELATQARRMVEGASDVTMVAVEGREYYLAFAPIPSMGWSFGTLIEKETVVQPAQEARSHLLAQAEEFNASLGGIFRDNLLRTAVILLALLAVLYIASRKAADRFVQPILTLRAGVRDIAGGNLDKKISIHTGDEIGELADSFNDMTDELKLYLKNLEQATAEKERIETELNLASRIQAGILPTDFPVGGRFDIFATMQSAKEVGGDFYDFYFLDDNCLLVTIADVSDKGVPAALFMIRAKTVLRNSVLTVKKNGGSLADAISMTNDELCKNNKERLFVTVFTAMLDFAARKVTYVNAGHNLPVILHPARDGSGQASFIPKGKDPMLAVMEDLEFAEGTLEFGTEDVLFLYTDGVTEAENCDMEMFSKEKLLCTLGNLTGKTARKIVEGVLVAVDEYAAGAEQSDDITMLCIRCK